VDDILRYSRSSQETGIKKGEYTRVVGVDAQKNLVTVVRADGSEQTYDPRRQMGVIAYRAQEKAFSVGDRIQFTSPDNKLKIANRELGIVEEFGADGRMRLKLDGGRNVAIDPEQHPHIDHGYAMTSYSSQGQTAERVLVHVDTELGAKDLLNNRMAYVAISRGQNDAQIFTNSADKLAGVLARDVSHQSAIEPQIGGTHPVQDIAKALHSELSHGIELGIGL
jgi:ATP-dependent exoDNAse (exonuclease V) alpha subunit